LKIAYIGTILNYGETLAHWGSGLILLLSNLEKVEAIDIYCPLFSPQNAVEINYSKKISVKSIIDISSFSSLLKVLRLLNNQKYDLVILNLNPTVFGNSSVINLEILLFPLLSKFLRKLRTLLIYHNSVITNDISILGYDSGWDKLRTFILCKLEKSLFKYVETFFLIDSYVTKINKVIPNNKVKFLDVPVMEAIPTLYLNSINLNSERMNTSSKFRKFPTILLHGYWGPQKDLGSALVALEKCEKLGHKFNLVISGVLNPHFPKYIEYFETLMNRHKHIISEIRGYTPENEILELFDNADLLLMPYVVAGGHSGVLAIAYALNTPTLARNLEEFSTLKDKYRNLAFYENDLFEKIMNFLLTWQPGKERKLYLKDIMQESMYNLLSLIEVGQH
jgi:glycosyltransferase involved in cell wall biosynthesis